MENLQQIVLQITTSPYERSIAQYGNGQLPSSQKEIIYSELNDDEKQIWDKFVDLIKSK